MRVVSVIVMLLVSQTLSAQKVALVLSGGAAKGIAHIGVLKALEENEIPIDYIVGTSMGGIVGGCYAAGMSPQEIESIVLSEDFYRWITGLPEKRFNYHYNSDEDNPSFVKLNLSLDSTLNFKFVSSFASDVSLNFALAEKMAQASAISNGNFDSLFIPLRILASDIFTQSQVVFSRGSLGDALRATQTVPFFYSPIRVEGKYLFDGGVYNNFPVDVAESNFQPDLIIGCNVSSKTYKEYPYDEDEKLISNSLMYMLLDNSDPDAVLKNGVYIQPNVKPYNSFDFVKARALIDSGYRQTMRQMKEIKEKVGMRRETSQLIEKRKQFHFRNKPWEFDDLTFDRFNSRQRTYIQRMFKLDPKKPRIMAFDEIKRGYFKLVSEPYFSNVYPSIAFNNDSEKFSLKLARRPHKNFQVDIGGVLASRNLSNIFLGLNYFHFNKSLSHSYLGIQTGSFYKSAIVRTRFDFPFFGRFYLQPEATFNEWDYLESTDLIQKVTPTVLKRFDRKVAVTMGWPLGNRLKASINFTGFNNDDRYSNFRKFNSGDTLDRLNFRGFKTGLILTANDLDRKQYATSGKSFAVAAYYFNGKEIYEPGNTSDGGVQGSHNRQWFRISATAEHYFSNGWYRPGYFAQAVFSNQPAFSNYTGTIVNAPAFLPFQDSPTLLLENFRAFNYLAFGLRNVFIIKKRLLEFRAEAYLFKPIEQILEGSNQEVVLNSEITSVFFAGTAGPVLHTPIGPISLSLNYYNDSENQLGVLLHVGFLLFNKHSVEQ